MTDVAILPLVGRGGASARAAADCWIGRAGEVRLARPAEPGHDGAQFPDLAGELGDAPGVVIGGAGFGDLADPAHLPVQRLKTGGMSRGHINGRAAVRASAWIAHGPHATRHVSGQP